MLQSLKKQPYIALSLLFLTITISMFASALLYTFSVFYLEGANLELILSDPLYCFFALFSPGLFILFLNYENMLKLSTGGFTKPMLSILIKTLLLLLGIIYVSAALHGSK